MHDIIDALEIILNNEPDAKLTADHNFIYAGSRANTYDEDDIYQLEQLDWFIDLDNSWRKHV